MATARVAGEMAEVALGLARAAEAMEGVTDTVEAEAVETATEGAWKGVAALGARQEAE